MTDHGPGLRNPIAGGPLVHIPGPNPIVKPGASGSWDDGLLEACDAIREGNTVYLYYHGTSATSGYQVGVVTAPHPLGPFTRPVDAPVLPVGPEGSWDSACTACAAILKEGPGRFLMLYSAKAVGAPPGHSIGLATADNPLGPWQKHEANPLLPGFGYVGGVVLVDGTYYLYTEHPVGSRGDDYGPMSLATAPAPEGPWAIHDEHVMLPGDWGEWDDGGFSESKVTYQGGLFHMLYGGAKLDPVRIRTRESIGYAWSTDGLHFHKHPLNPVAPRQANPDAAAFAEVHALWEPPFVYCYHTHRYESVEGVVEDLGVQVLTWQRPFRLTMPVLVVESLGPTDITRLGECPPICLAAARSCALCVEGRSAAGLTVHVRASGDGIVCDTEDLQTFSLPHQSGEIVRATFDVPTGAAYLKVLVENRDPFAPATDVRVDAVLGG